jgi:ribosomal protein S18 acetylase RimI-like enzyme
LPATLIGRLARDVAFRRQRVGDLLLLDALKRALGNVGTVASLAVIVDVKDEHARRFYSKYGFLSFPDAKKRMYLPMKTVERLFRGRATT